jgi:hypothetical protein
VKQLAAALGHQKQWRIVGVSDSEIDALRAWVDKKNASVTGTNLSALNKPRNSISFEGLRILKNLSADELKQILFDSLGYQKQWQLDGITSQEWDAVNTWIFDHASDPRPSLDSPTTAPEPINSKPSSPNDNLKAGNRSVDFVASQFGVSVEKLVKQLASALGHQKQWKVVGVSNSEIDRLREWRARTGKKSDLEVVQNSSSTNSKVIRIDDLASEFGISAIDVVGELANQKRLVTEPDHKDFNRWWTSGATESEAWQLRNRIHNNGIRVKGTLGSQMNRKLRRLIRKQRD